MRKVIALIIILLASPIFMVLGFLLAGKWIVDFALGELFLKD
jgi:hypothetical protein